MPDWPWYPLDERERQIEWALEARRKGRRPATGPRAANLVEDLQARRLVSVGELSELAARRYSQVVVSLYFNLTPDRLVRRPPVALSVFNSMRHRALAARQSVIDRLSRAQRGCLQRDLDEIERVIGESDLVGARSLVVLKSGHELNRLIRLPVRTAESLTIDHDPYIEPLEAVLEEHPPALVVKVSKNDSHLYSEQLGHLEEIESLKAFVPSDTADAGRSGKTQRHRLTHLRWHLKATAQLASRLFAEGRFSLLILAGDESVVADFERFLPDQVRARVASRLHPSPRQDAREWQRQIGQVLAAQRRLEEEASLADLGEYAARGVLTTGLADVLEVVNRFRARRLFVSTELRQPGFVCRQHHFLSLHEGRCPFCNEELFPAENLVDELIEFARMHGVEVTLIEETPALLDHHVGVAAVTYEVQSEPARPERRNPSARSPS